MSRCRGLAWSLALVLVASGGQAEDGADTTGLLLRVKAREADGRTVTITGRLIEVDAQDTLVVGGSSPVEVFRVPRERVVQLERATPRSRGQGLARGAGIGLAVGALSGAAIGLASGDDECRKCFLSFSAGDKALLGGFALGALGGLLGGAVGAGHPGQRWVPLGILTDRVSLAAPMRGVGAGVTLRF
jgi:hypothetical protein